jgi:apolipoprotein N-acyltransferase
VLFDHPKGPFFAAICYESAFPEIIRRFVAEGARFAVNITNDGWYGFSSGPVQHAALAAFRAIETRRPIARSANTGISGFYDRCGLFHERTQQYVPDIRLFDLPLGSADMNTYFVRLGMYLGKMSTALTLAVLIFCAVGGWLNRRRDEDSPPEI